MFAYMLQIDPLGFAELFWVGFQAFSCAWSVMVEDFTTASKKNDVGVFLVLGGSRQ